MTDHNTGIEWTHHPGYRGETWNPLAAFDEDGNRGWFCTHVSEGCRNCYAEKLNVEQRHGMGTGHEYKHQNLDEIEFRLVNVEKPVTWQKPRCVFVNSMTDLFHEAVAETIIERIFAAMALGAEHRFLVLTKRPQRMLEFMRTEERRQKIARMAVSDPEYSVDDQTLHRAFKSEWPPPNVWLGVSVEDQHTLEERVPTLQQTPAAKRFVSCEPLLGPLDFVIESQPILVNTLRGETGVEPPIPGLDWVIAGGESGPNARPPNPEWFRMIRDQCQMHDTPFFFKQWGAWAPVTAIPSADTDSVFSERKTFSSHGAAPDDKVFRVGKNRTKPILDSNTYTQLPETE